MPRRLRRNNSPLVKSKVALAAIKGDKTITELSQQFGVHPNQITQWKTQLLDRIIVVFEGPGKTDPLQVAGPRYIYCRIPSFVENSTSKCL